MELPERLAHLVPHWIEHNESHAQQFEEKAKDAQAAGLVEVAGRIEAAARLMREANEELKQAQRGLPQADSAHH